MKIHINERYSCRILRINDVETNYIASFKLNEEYICKININSVERSCYERIKDELSVTIVAEIDDRFVTFIDCQLYEKAFRVSENPSQNNISLSFISSLLIDDYKWEYCDDISFNGFIISITEIIELLGFYPYDVCYSDIISKDVTCISGNNIYKEIGAGYSFFVAPYKKQTIDGVHLSIQAKIQFDSDEKKSIRCIQDRMSNICLFFE